MRRRGQTIAGIQTLVDRKIDSRIDGLNKTGVIVRVSGRKAYVRLDGSSAIKPVDVYIDDPQPGERCILTRPSNSSHWMITGRMNTTSQPVSEFNPSNFGELSPPSNLVALPNLSGFCAWNWASPPQKSVAFEFEVNTTATEVGATTYPYTRGSYLLIPSNVALYARGRSVGPHFQTSSWSSWVSCSPGQSVSRWEPLTNGDPGDPELIFADGDVIMVEVPY